MYSKRYDAVPQREHLFIRALLMRGGYRKAKNRLQRTKFNTGYVVPADRREDQSGTDVWVKNPHSDIWIPLQLTQRGVRLQQQFHPDITVREDMHRERIRKKQAMSDRYGMAFVLVGDYVGEEVSPRVAWSDVKALKYSLKRHQHILAQKERSAYLAILFFYHFLVYDVFRRSFIKTFGTTHLGSAWR